MSRPSGGAPQRDVYTTVTTAILAAMEAGAGEFVMPWHRTRGAVHAPVNIASGKPYRGVNILALWVACEMAGFSSPVWGTYKQWQAKGAQVRKGEKSTTGVFFKDLDIADTDATTGETTDRRIGMGRAFHLFNLAQVDGYAAVAELDPAPAPRIIDPIARADALVAASGAQIQHDGGEQAFYRPSTDSIHLPLPERFHGTPTSTPTESYYAVKLHELTHWTGAKTRLDRDLASRFKTNAYAMEELVAELGAAYLCCALEVSLSPRPDHAQYLTGWLEVLKVDNRAIFTAAAQAQRACDYLLALEEPSPPGPDSAPADSPFPSPQAG